MAFEIDRTRGCTDPQMKDCRSFPSGLRRASTQRGFCIRKSSTALRPRITTSSRSAPASPVAQVRRAREGTPAVSLTLTSFLRTQESIGYVTPLQGSPLVQVAAPPSAWIPAFAGMTMVWREDDDRRDDS